jgi:hypothetical protein
VLVVDMLCWLPGWSPSKPIKGPAMPREFSVACCATRIFDAATIFMADVIFAMFCTDLMRSFTAAQPQLGRQDGAQGPATPAYLTGRWCSTLSREQAHNSNHSLLHAFTPACWDAWRTPCA